MEDQNNIKLESLLNQLNSFLMVYKRLKQQLEDHKSGIKKITIVGLKKLESKFAMLSEEIDKINNKIKSITE